MKSFCLKKAVISRPFFKFLILAVLIAAAGCSPASPFVSQGGSGPRAVFISSDKKHQAVLSLEEARTPSERQRGLMERKALSPDQGMIFIYEEPVVEAFWMKNTYIPLSIAFVSKDGTIEDIQEMQPLTTELHAPPAPYIYAIEANQGYFSSKGLKTGDQVNFENL